MSIVLQIAAAGCATSVGEPSGTVTWQGQLVALADQTFESTADAPTGGVPVACHFLPGGKPLPPGEAGQTLRCSGRAPR